MAPTTSFTNNSSNFLAGGGEMGEHIRSLDWSQTAIGPTDAWPQSLRTMLSVVLNSQFPMLLYWGPELICIYNDAFRPSLGNDGKHPGSLGKPGSEFLPEAWHELGPVLAGVVAGGEATWNEDQLIPIYRNGKIENVYWTYSFSPVFDESGAPGGVLATCFESTQKVLTMARLEESTDELSFAIEATELATWDVEPLTNTVKGNVRLKEWFGLSADREVDVQTAVDAIAEEDQAHVIAAIQRAYEFSSGGRYDVEYGIIHPHTKKERYVRAKGRAWFNEDKVAYRFNGTLQDITTMVLVRKRLEESESRFRNMLEQAPVAIALTRSKDHVFKSINPSMLRIINKEHKDEVIGKALTEVLPELVDQPIMGIYQNVLQTGQSFIGNQIPVRVNFGGKPELRYYNLSYTPLLEEEKVTGIIHAAVDVTEQILAQQRAQQYAEELKESEQRFRLFVQASNDTLYRMSADWQQMLTLEGRDFLVKTDKPRTTWIDDYLPQEDQVLALRTIQEAIQTKGVFELEHRVVKADGSVGWTFSRAIPVLDREGEIMEWFGAATDITEQKQAQEALEESEQRFRIMADATPNIVWALNPDTTLKYVNNFMLVFLGISMKEFVAINWEPIIHPDDLELTQQTIEEAFEDRKVYAIEQRLLRHDGEYRWVLTQGAPSYFANGELYGYVGSCLDITEIKQAEEKLQLIALELSAANVELRSSNLHVQEANDLLSSSNQQLNFVNADMDNFIYTASHDLRSPISNIEGLMHAIQEDLSAESMVNPVVLNMFAMMAASIVRFKQTINDMTEVTKLQREDTSGEAVAKVDLSQMIKEVQLDLHSQIELAGAELEVVMESCEPVSLSPKNVRSMLYNLISNAVKYRAPNRKLLIQIRCRREGNYQVLSIQDNGLGMDNPDENKVFGMFKRLHDHVEGTGLGLYIVKNIIENAGGKIKVESQINEGTIFRVYFKLRTPSVGSRLASTGVK